MISLRASLIDQLALHPAEDEKERADLEAMRRHAALLPDPTSRQQQPAHFTASAVVVALDGARVCLVHHKKLGRWLQPGGHIEPGESTLEAALREAREETDLDVVLHPRCHSLLDVDVHFIPARGASPAHEHLDLRYLVLARSETARHDPEESLAARWFDWEPALALASDAALVRLLEKARRKM